MGRLITGKPYQVEGVYAHFTAIANLMLQLIFKKNDRGAGH